MRLYGVDARFPFPVCAYSTSLQYGPVQEHIALVPMKTLAMSQIVQLANQIRRFRERHLNPKN